LSAGSPEVVFATSIAADALFPAFALGAALVGAPETAAAFAFVGLPSFLECTRSLLVVTAEVADRLTFTFALTRGVAVSVAAAEAAAEAEAGAEAEAIAVAVVADVAMERGQANAWWPRSPHVKQALRATLAAFLEAVSSTAAAARVLAFLEGAFEQWALSAALSSGYSFLSRPICQQQESTIFKVL
jgi:hypothetical protein